MPSSYSTNLKIELQATGENSGTWGTITNTNLGTALEQAIVGYGNPSYASDANLTLTYTDTNAAQAARALVLNVTSAVSLTGTRELVVPTIQKQYIVQNNTTGSQSITVKTSAGTGITVPNGRKAHLYVNGTDVIFMDDFVDINGGAIDGTTIGANSAAAGTFTTVGATTGNITTVNATTVDTTNIEVTNLKAKDGTAAGSIADSTGVVTLGSSVLTTTDINGGTIDGTTIGGSSAAAGTFTTLTTSSTVTLNGGTANGVLYLNGSKVATSGSALTFNGSEFATTGVARIGAGARIQGSGALSGTGVGAEIFAAGGVVYYSSYDRTGAAYAPLNLFSGTYTAFSVGSEQMRLTSTGLGIGTSSPSYRLDVIGSAPARFNTTANNQVVLAVNSTAYGQIFANANTAFGITDGGATGTLLNLNQSGNLGLGVTPSAWGSGFRAIQGYYGVSLAFDGGFVVGRLVSNTYNNNTNWLSTLANIGAARFEFGDFASTSSASFRWLLAPGVGSAGSALTFTQAMTLDANGNLGIGTTSPTERLDIYKASSNVRIRMSADSGYSASLTLVGNSREAYVYNSDGDLNLYNNYASGTIRFYTNGNNERARITSGGYFKASNTGSYVLSTGDYHELRQSQDGITLIVSATNASQTANVVEIYGARNTTNNTYYPLNYYNTGAAAYKFRVADSGDVTNTNGTYGTISDAKMKTDIVDAGSQWADIKALRFRKFKMKDDPSGLTQLGVVAQEVEQTSPGLVDEHADFEEVEVTDDEGNVKKERQPTGTTTKSVKTSILLMKAAVALQEAMARIEKLEAEMAALKGA